MNKFWTTIFLLVTGLSSFAQDWLKNAVPKDLDQTCLIIEKLDSMGMKCRVGKKPMYCNDFDRNIDKLLPSLQKLQESACQKYNLSYIMVLPKAFPYQEFNDFKDLNKFRYILKMQIFPPMDDKDSSPLWLYYFYDRKTQKAYPRIHQIQDVKFKYLKDLINSLNKKFEKAETK